MEIDFCRVTTDTANAHMKKDETTCCVFMKGDWTCMWKCMAMAQQWKMFCMECRTGLPCNQEYPCILNVFGLTCCVGSNPCAAKMKFGCLKTYGELNAGGAPATTIDDSHAMPAPALASMEREEAARSDEKREV